MTKQIDIDEITHEDIIGVLSYLLRAQAKYRRASHNRHHPNSETVPKPIEGNIAGSVPYNRARAQGATIEEAKEAKERSLDVIYSIAGFQREFDPATT